MPLQRKPLKPTIHLGPRPSSIASQDLCTRLVKALPYVPNGSKNFARSLIQNHETYGGWTPKQLEHAELLLERAREEYRAQHLSSERTAERQKGEGPRVSGPGMAGLRKLFDAAADAKLKTPAILLQAGEIRFKLKAAREGSDFVLFDRTQSGADGFMGGLKATGLVDLRPRMKDHAQAVCDALDDLGSNPAKAAKRFGKDTGSCCFCARELTDDRSIKAGYGPICASNYGLPWGE